MDQADALDVDSRRSMDRRSMNQSVGARPTEPN